MKKALFLVLIPAVVVVFGVGAVLLFDDSPLTPSAPECGLSIHPSLANAVRPNTAQDQWSVYSFDGTATAPRILIREEGFDGIPGVGSIQGCELEIRSLPAADARGLDWRIGYLNVDVAALRGKAVRARFFLKAEDAAELGSGSVYIYDGLTVSGAQVSRISRDWTEFEVSHPVPEDAETFEFWFRLLIDRPAVSPASNVLSVAARLEEADGVELNAQASDFTPTSCPLQVGDSLDGIEINRPDRWFVYRFEGSGAPNVDIKRTVTAESSDGPSEWCALNVTNAPTDAGRGVDWRVGHIFEVADLRGETVTFSADLRADRPTKLSSARLYTNDGSHVAETVIDQIGEDWERHELTVDIPPDAATFQIWFRLIFDDGTVSPGDVEISFAPRLERTP